MTWLEGERVGINLLLEEQKWVHSILFRGKEHLENFGMGESLKIRWESLKNRRFLGRRYLFSIPKKCISSYK
jgi:hypothetical protein